MSRSAAELATIDAVFDYPPHLSLVLIAFRLDVVLEAVGEVAPFVEEHSSGFEVLDGRLDVPDEEPAQAIGSGGVELRRLAAPLDETVGALVDDIEQQLLLRADVGVERPSQEPERVAEVLHRGAVVAALGEQAGGRAHHLGAPRGSGPVDDLGHSAPSQTNPSQTNSRLETVPDILRPCPSTATPRSRSGCPSSSTP